jgi:hypothetical protein
VRSRPPTSRPPRPDPPDPSANRHLGSNRHRDNWVRSGGAGQIGSKRLDLGAPAAPRQTLPAGQRPAEGDARLPFPPQLGSLWTFRSTPIFGRLGCHASEATGEPMSSNEYLLDNSAEETGQRFGALSALFNATTFRHMEALGIAQGWRCWEVGAGGPSVPSWLAERVGKSGHVFATDNDTSWFNNEIDPRIEVRQHDIVRDSHRAACSTWCTPGLCFSISRSEPKRSSGWSDRYAPEAGFFWRTPTSAYSPQHAWNLIYPNTTGPTNCVLVSSSC